MTEFIFTYITCESHSQAEQIATILVEEDLVACANIFPNSTSIYKWEGHLQRGEETVLLLKSRLELFAKIEARVKEIHTYDIACILSFRIVQGNEQFLDWVKTQTKG